MSDDKTNENTETNESQDAGSDPAAGQQGKSPNQSGPKFTDAPDPLSGVKKTTSDLMASMEGKTVSMKTYVGTIIGIVILMLLARCGG